MSAASCPSLGSQPLLSPKQAQQRRLRSLTLAKLDKQIANILAQNSQEHHDFRDYLSEYKTLENIYAKENAELKQALDCLQENYDYLEKMYLVTKEELDASHMMLEKSQRDNKGMEKEIAKLKKMVENQENLIDEYRSNLEQEIELERELMKSVFAEEKTKMEREFTHALAQIERQYEEKLKKVSKSQIVRQYKSECNELKRYLQSSKQNLHKFVKPPLPADGKKPISSEYSTNANEHDCRHNTAVFIS